MRRKEKDMDNAQKIRVNLSLSKDTAERLKQYAWENHKNVSQAVTDWIWNTKVKQEQVRGQSSLNLK